MLILEIAEARGRKFRGSLQLHTVRHTICKVEIAQTLHYNVRGMSYFLHRLLLRRLILDTTTCLSTLVRDSGRSSECYDSPSTRKSSA
jgi:hypothetical protein